MKKLLAILMTLTLLFSFAGCNEKTSDKATSEESVKRALKLFWVYPSLSISSEYSDMFSCVITRYSSLKESSMLRWAGVAATAVTENKSKSDIINARILNFKTFHPK